jgi:hypothetical protein
MKGSEMLQMLEGVSAEQLKDAITRMLKDNVIEWVDGNYKLCKPTGETSETDVK